MRWIDIVIPSNNEKEFVETAKRLNYSGIIFLYQDISKSELKEKQDSLKFDIPCYYGLYKKVESPREAKIPLSMFKEADFIVGSATDEKCIRKILENKRYDCISELTFSIGKDKVTQRISNLNEVLVKLAYKNNVAYGLSFYHILIAKNRPKLIGREMQNIRLCKGVNKPLVLIASFARKPDQMRWPHDLVSLGVVLGLPENYAKLGHSDFIWQKLDLKQQIKRGELVVPGVKLVT